VIGEALFICWECDASFNSFAATEILVTRGGIPSFSPNGFHASSQFASFGQMREGDNYQPPDLRQSLLFADTN
jgi:hypothetical protein